jgi:adenylate cyclase
MALHEDYVRKNARTMRIMRRVMRAMPSNPRCKLCLAPFRGFGGRVVKVAGFSPSRKNPNYCKACFEEGPDEGEELEIGVLFADIRGYTTLTETAPPEEVRTLLARFYDVATNVLIKPDAVIDKLYGDEVMALFLPHLIPEDEVIPRMVSAAESLLRAVGYGSTDGAWCPLGVGLAFGTAYVGNVGAGEVKDFTAIGDVVNTGSRLQGAAGAGEIVMSSRVYDAVRAEHLNARRDEIELKGKRDLEEVYIVSLAAPAVPA